jgi:ABC-type Fe3+/spermidine/putrescine transport system ATPase subunit
VQKWKVDERVLVCVRPEHWRLLPEQSGLNAIPGEIAQEEYRGDTTDYVFVTRTSAPCRLRVRSLTSSEPPKLGAKVLAWVAPHDVAILPRSGDHGFR